MNDTNNKKFDLVEIHGHSGRFEKILFNFRLPWLLFFAVITAFLFYHAAQVRPDASLQKMIPGNHEFIQNFFKYSDDLAAMGNAVRISVDNY